MSEVRVRFAPSPTGYLHIGGVRAALYGWLWARQNGGKFILRIEDTDRERSTEASVQAVLDSMKWLNLDWDEGPEVGGDHGPYFQTQRLEIYNRYVEQLLESGAAYRCYATPEELAEAREQHFEATGRKEGFKFRSPYRDVTEKLDKPFVIRLKMPTEGSISWDDLIRGKCEYPCKENQDVVLVRKDGIPLYNFGCVVDDLEMGMTLVCRGEDHMINTPIQLQLYKALGAEPPKFAHMPLVLNPKGGKLSKRDAAVSVLDYKDLGYLPDAVLNYLVRLGWSAGDQEVFTRADLVEKFNWEAVGKAGAKYDLKKFEFVQAEHLRMLDDAKLAELLVPWLRKNGHDVAADDARLLQAIPFIKPRATTLVDAADALDYFFRSEFDYDEKGKKKFLTPDAAPHLRALADFVATQEPFDNATLDPAVKAWMEEKELKMKVVAQPARIALTGRTASPGLFEVMEVLGKDESLARLHRAADVAEASTGDA